MYINHRNFWLQSTHAQCPFDVNQPELSDSSLTFGSTIPDTDADFYRTCYSPPGSKHGSRER